ncbi:MAG: F0F1 ATP synthase subunit B family protein [Nitrospirota bacterium]
MKKSLYIVMTGIMGVALAAAAFASEAAHGAEEYTFMADWLPRIANFAIIVGLLVYFLRKPVRDMFANRSASIAKAMEESRQAREQAVAALAEMERKSRDMETETRAMIAEAQARGEKDKQALVEEGKKIVKDIQEQIKTGTDVEVQKAKAALAAEAAVLAVDLAEGTIRSTIGKQDHERIVKEYVSKVGGRG